MKKRISSMLAILIVLSLVIGIIPEQKAEAASKTKAYKAYREWLKNDAPRYYKYKLVKIDSDSVPELVAINDGSDNSGVYQSWIICTYDGERVNKKEFSISFSYSGTWYAEDASYLPQKGKFMLTELNRGNGEEKNVIYKVKNGKIKRIHTAKIGEELKFYKFDGKTVTKSQYNKKLKKAYNERKAKGFGKLKGFKSKKKMLAKLG